MKHQFTITVDTDDVTLAMQVRDEAAGAIEDFIESRRPGVGIDCGQLIDIGSPEDLRYIAAARHAHGKDGEIEIDDNAVVSPGDDPGAYVQAWVWAGDDDVAAAEGAKDD